MAHTVFSLEVRPRLPERLARLAELADNMLFSWHWQVRGLFPRIDRKLWEQSRHDPQVFLKRVSQARLEQIAQDRTFLMYYGRALSTFDAYMEGSHTVGARALEHGRDLVAYFCMEYGLHESLRLYSGGLGILAGDHCKAASDLSYPFVAVGLLYHQGYFDQTIDADGVQLDSYPEVDFADMPVKPLLDGDNEVRVEVEIAERTVGLKVWRLRVGQIDLLLLDSDVDGNSERDRRITRKLYGGDNETRLLQEICLGVGGVRALRAAGLAPTAWHINEGHAAFMVLERCRELVANGLDFESALEAVAAATLFTTHTPVAAGHDFFEIDEIESQLAVFGEQLGIDTERLLALGHNSHREEGLNMTSLALRGSRFHNGVSRIHGRTASQMEAYAWPEVPPAENPMESVTNGVHLETFLASEWGSLFDQRFGDEWRGNKTDVDFWARIQDVPDQSFWGVRQTIKARFLAHARKAAQRRCERIGCTAADVRAITRHLRPDRPDVLTVGFARRFTAYKRATLLFRDPERLARLANDPERPVCFVFAGKAHPRDTEGQALLKQLDDYSRSDEFRGRVVLLEGYDLALARHLVPGVDVWLNTPDYPLEASGTSGQKAGINGVLNLSVLDGWWPEGFDGENGWAITPYASTEAETRNRVEARELLELLENEIVPLYYARGELGFSPGWVQRCKRAMETLIPRFNSERMVREYATRFYAPASRGGQEMAGDDFAQARTLAEWKQRVTAAWPGVTLHLRQAPVEQIEVGDAVEARIVVNLAGLHVDDVRVECVATKPRAGLDEQIEIELEAAGDEADGGALYSLRFRPEDSGPLSYRFRVYPAHELMRHRFEAGLMRWL